MGALAEEEVDDEGDRDRPSRRPADRRDDAVRTRDRRAPRQARVPLRGQRGGRLSQPSPPRRRVRSAVDDARAGRAHDGEPQEDARGGRLHVRRSGIGHPLSDRRGRAGRSQSRVGCLSRRPPADHDHGRGLAAGHPRAVQARDQRDRRGRRGRQLMAPVGFVGLGTMGSRMAKRLLASGREVVGYNRTPEKARALVEAGLVLQKSPRAVAEASDAVLSMVTDSTALRAIALGADGVIAGLRPGAVWAEMSTVSPGVTRELGHLVAERGAALIDAPVSGSAVTVDAGQLSFMVGGDPAALEKVRGDLLAIGPTITHVGELGLAVTMKVATNLSLAVQMLAFSEAVALAEKAGIARERAVEVLLKSVIASPMVKYRGPFVLGMPPEALFNVDMCKKDLGLALEMGKALGVPLPSVALADQLMTAARGLDLADYDFAVVFDVIARMSGLRPSVKSPR